MPLKISLKPNERILINGAVITNGSSRSEIFIENEVPLLRQKDIMGEREADTVCRKIYFCIQLMYIDGNQLPKYHKTYWELVRALLEATPSAVGLLDQISEHIVGNRYYQALKTSKRLMDYEQEVLQRVS
jgi:flagellar protein FlbT